MIVNITFQMNGKVQVFENGSNKLKLCLQRSEEQINPLEY